MDGTASSEAKDPAAGGSEPRRVLKNIVICCDGTGNQVTGDYSNVLKLFRMLKKDGRQRAYYDPGVGTIGADDDWQRRKTRIKAVLGLATGAGLDDNVLDAYRFLANTYEPGDCVYLFGFSRGAYTVRELAGFLHMVGLLKPDQLNLCDYALTTYKQAGERSERVYEQAERSGQPKPAPLPTGGAGASGQRTDRPTAPSGRSDDEFVAAWKFGKVTGTRHVPIHFMGCWDTVASMIVPGRTWLSPPKLRTLPYTRFNPSVRAFRHAMAIDERRRMFRLNRWKSGQQFVVNPFSDPPAKQLQDCEQRWFAGVHSDIGGGYPEEQSSLSKPPLIWMVKEAVAHGLRIDDATFRRLACNEPPPEHGPGYRPPNPLGPMHRSLHGFWWVLEYIPKSARWREWRRGFLGLYFPRGEPRVVEPEAVLHASAKERQAAAGPGPGPAEGETYAGCDYPPYRPVNLVERRPLPAEEGKFGPIARTVLAILTLTAIATAVSWSIGCWWGRHLRHRHAHHLHHLRGTDAGAAEMGTTWVVVPPPRPD